MQSFLRVVFVLFLLSFHEQGNATRYLPSIVWDHLNPMLSCKCNWFNPIAMIEIYDRFEFVCPTSRIHTLLLARYSRPVSQMNLNIFQRKWEGGIDTKGINELKKQMISGDFCDPTHNKTEKVFTCKMGELEGKTIRFAGDAGFYKDDIVVYFNNADDGRESSLASTQKRCAMAFVTKATWNVAQRYDFTYEKNLDNLLSECNDVNTTCKEETTPAPCTSAGTSTLPSTTLPSTTTPSTTSSTTSPPTTITITNATSSSTETTPQSSTTKPTTEENDTGGKKTSSTTESLNSSGELQSRKSDNKFCDNFTYGFFTGFATLLFLIILAALIYRLYCRPKKKKNKKTNSVCQYKVEDKCASTEIKNGSAEPLPKKNLLSNNNERGINNKAYKRDTLERFDHPA